LILSEINALKRQISEQIECDEEEHIKPKIVAKYKASPLNLG
jgi:hypothetical protein